MSEIVTGNNDIPEFLKRDPKAVDSNDFGKWIRRERVRIGIRLADRLMANVHLATADGNMKSFTAWLPPD